MMLNCAKYCITANTGLQYFDAETIKNTILQYDLVVAYITHYGYDIDSDIVRAMIIHNAVSICQAVVPLMYYTYELYDTALACNAKAVDATEFEVDDSIY